MRLIDADALKEKAFGKRGGLIHTSDVDAMPTIEPEQKHGWWIETESDDPCFYRCSECKRMVDEDFRFCPNCGARMDKGDES